MVRKRRLSKRVTLSKKYRIEKNVKNHNRRERREARKNPKRRQGLSKDPGIPNLCPFKEDFIKRMEKTNERLREYNERNKQSRKAQLMAKRSMSKTQQMADLAKTASASASVFAAKRPDEGGIITNTTAGKQTRRAFFKHLRKVVDAADVIVEVLDARDPLGCRATAIEDLALQASPRKRVILLLNKIDLVPAEVVQKWLVYLRREFPTLAFKASTQKQQKGLHAPKGARVGRAVRAGTAVTGSGAAGAELLLQLIKNYSRNEGIKTAVTVGVIGYPNVGKSSVINSLKRSKAARVSPMPGCTTTMQQVQLDKKVKLLDCPGIIFDDGGDVDGASLLLKNCVKVSDMEDPELAVEGIINRCNPQKLMELYAIAAYSNAQEFLRLVAKKKGMLQAGGVANVKAAATSVLQDWNTGKVPFFTLPPDVEDKKHERTAIVTEWAKEFDMDALMADESDGIYDATAKDASAFVTMTSSDRPAGLPDDAFDEDDEADMSGSSDDEMAPAAGAGAGVGAGARKVKQVEVGMTPALAKRLRKNSRRTNGNAQAKAAATAAPSGDGDASMDGDNDDYDFSTDFAY